MTIVTIVSNTIKTQERIEKGKKLSRFNVLNAKLQILYWKYYIFTRRKKNSKMLKARINLQCEKENFISEYIRPKIFQVNISFILFNLSVTQH